MRPETIHAVPHDDAVFEWVFMSAFSRGPVDTGVSVSVSRLVTFDTLPFCPSKPSQSLATGFALAETVISSRKGRLPGKLFLSVQFLLPANETG